MMQRRLKPVKNRKDEARKKRIQVSLIIGSFLIVVTGFSLVISLFVFYPSVISPLPKLTFANDSLSDKDKKMKEILLILAEKKIKLTHIGVASDGAFVLQLASGSEVLLSGEKDPREQISSLQLILSRLTMEDRRFSRLDLRYDKPVIVVK